MIFTFEKNYRPTNDAYLFEGRRYDYIGDVENEKHCIVGKVYQYESDLILAILDSAVLTLDQHADAAIAVETETGLIVSHNVWEAHKDGYKEAQ